MFENLFEKLCKEKPSWKTIQVLMQDSRNIDEWMMAHLKEYVRNEDQYRGRREWPIIHIVRVVGEKRLVESINCLIYIVVNLHEEYLAYIWDSALVALEKMGEAAFKPLFKAFKNEESREIQNTLMGVICSLGVKNTELRDILIANFDDDPAHIAHCIADYGDETLLPILYEYIKIIAPIVKRSLPLSHMKSLEHSEYIEIREAIQILEGTTTYLKDSDITLDNYYRVTAHKVKLREKSKEFSATEKKWEKDDLAFDLRFLGISGNHPDKYNFVHNDNVINFPQKVGRNEPCPCGSGKKFKKCCLNKISV